MPDAYDVAIQTELDGRKMYLDAARRAGDRLARSMFEALAGDELRHLQLIKKASKRDVPAEDAAPGTPEIRDLKRGIQTVFSLAGCKLSDRVVVSATDTEAIRIAMEFETRGHRFYQEHARKTMDKDQKRLFQELALWESEHLSLLQNLMLYFEDAESWYAWQEQHLSDGG